jgi:hypothetical protein
MDSLEDLAEMEAAERFAEEYGANDYDEFEEV